MRKRQMALVSPGRRRGDRRQEGARGNQKFKKIHTWSLAFDPKRVCFPVCCNPPLYIVMDLRDFCEFPIPTLPTPVATAASSSQTLAVGYSFF